MHDDDPSAAEEAERVVDEEAKRISTSAAAALGQMLEALSGFAEQVHETLHALMPQLDELRRLCDEINRYEAEQIKQWENEMFDSWREL